MIKDSEVYQVTALSFAEVIPNIVLSVDAKGGCFFLMEGRMIPVFRPFDVGGLMAQLG